MNARLAAAIATAVVTLDQASKWLVVLAFPFGHEREVIDGVFRLVHTRNRGIAFGLLGSSSDAVQIVLLVVVIAVVLLIARQLRASGNDGLGGTGLALVLGGAVGNLIDRLTRGEVVDFLDFYLRWGGVEHHWPSFNVADSCISIGAGLVVLAELIRGRRVSRAPHSR